MLTPETIEKMNAMKLFGLVSAFETQLSSSEYKELSFEERVGLLVDAEWTAREQRKLSRRLRAAKLRYPACLENVNFQAPRGLNREPILSLGNCRSEPCNAFSRIAPIAEAAQQWAGFAGGLAPSRYLVPVLKPVRD